MTYELIPFSRWHVQWLIDEGVAEGGMGPMLDIPTLTYLEQENSWTAMLDGKPLCSAGTMRQWKGRHVAWAYLHKNTAPHMFYITKRVMIGIKLAQGRIETTVRKDFEKGHRWVKMLGFEVESPLLRAYGPLGEDHVGYVMMNG